MAKGPLSKLERFYIDSNSDKPIEEIAHYLERSVSTIQKYYPTKKTEEEKPVERKETPFMQAMGRHKRDGKIVATVLTQAASQIAESSKGKKKPLDPNTIHKPMG